MDERRSVGVVRKALTLPSIPQHLVGPLSEHLATLSSNLALADSPSESPLYPLLIQLARRLAPLEDGLPWQSWPDFCFLYAPRNASLAQEVVEAAANAGSGRSLAQWRIAGVPLFERLANQISTLDHVARFSKLVRAIAQASPLVAKPLGLSLPLMRSLAKLHDETIPSLAPPSSDATSARAKEDLLTAYVALLEAAYVSTLSKPISVASDPRSSVHCLTSLLAPLPSRAATRNALSIPDLTLFEGLACLTSLGERLAQIGERLSANAGGPDLSQLADRFLSVRASLSTVMDARISSASKGKAKATAADAPDPTFASLLAKVRDVLPDVDAQAVLAAYEADAIVGRGGQDAVERVIASGLDGTLGALGARTAPEALVDQRPSARRNVFDGDKLDVSLLRQGKAKVTADAVLADKSHLTEDLKSRIIARAEAPSDSDEEDDGHAPIPAFEESDDQVDARKRLKVVDIFDDDFEDPDLAPVRVRAGDDASSSSDEDFPALQRRPPAAPLPPPAPAIGASTSGQFTPTVERVLQQAYAASPATFEKKARGTTERQALMRKIGGGIADDLVESWATMFSRNPQKDKILAKFEFAGNRNAPPEGEAGAPPGRGGAREGGRGRGEGSRGRGRGGRGGGRGAHDRRVRGHDKKMQRMGATS